MKPFLLWIMVCLISTLSSCKTDSVNPTTGDITVNVKGNAPSSGVSYALYTEATYQKGVQPLRSGLALPNSAGAMTIQFQNLNAGNYVIVVGAQVVSAQVVAGKTTEIGIL
ncbi:MAG: hypothetical protein U0Y10_06940 [Spirosomataceae bacterium]